MSDTPRTDASECRLQYREARGLYACEETLSYIEPEFSRTLERELAAVTAERDKLRAELERERMRLAACGVVATANTPETAVKARTMHADYRSASCDEVASAVDEQMWLRAELSDLRENWNALQTAIVGETGASAIHEVDRMKRAMRVVEVGTRWLHFVPSQEDPYDQSAQIDLENALREWEAGR